MAAGALIAAVIAYSLVPRQSDKLARHAEHRHDRGRPRHDLPRLTGTDRKGHPFLITADSAKQEGANMHRASLKNVQADMTLEKGRWLNATAVNGFIDMDKHWLALNGGIAVFSDDGYELHTTRANVDLKQGIFSGPSEVTGHGPPARCAPTPSRSTASPTNSCSRATST